MQYSAGLIGYGSDVLGYDDEVSRDHMWGPRFYMFLNEDDIDKKDEIFNKFAENLPYEYMGYSVNFTEPDPNDCGVQHPQLINSGKVNPLIFIQTLEAFLIDEIGTADLDNIKPLDWLAFSEHRLLSLVSGKLFVDKLNIRKLTDKIKFYPDDVNCISSHHNGKSSHSNRLLLSAAVKSVMKQAHKSFVQELLKD